MFSSLTRIMLSFRSLWKKKCFNLPVHLMWCVCTKKQSSSGKMKLLFIKKVCAILAVSRMLYGGDTHWEIVNCWYNMWSVKLSLWFNLFTITYSLYCCATQEGQSPEVETRYMYAVSWCNFIEAPIDLLYWPLKCFFFNLCSFSESHREVLWFPVAQDSNILWNIRR